MKYIMKQWKGDGVFGGGGELKLKDERAKKFPTLDQIITED
jgi:hypothetical protein